MTGDADDDVRDTLIDCMTSAGIHGDLAQAAADILLSDVSGLFIGAAGAAAVLDFGDGAA
jgi:hypothetical protein